MAHLRGVFCLAVAQAGIPLTGDDRHHRQAAPDWQRPRLEGAGSADGAPACATSRQNVPSDLSDAIALAIAGLHQIRA